MSEKNVVPLFGRAVAQSDAELLSAFVTERKTLLASPLTNDELLERIPFETRCLGALSVVAEINARIQNLRAASELPPEL